MNRADGIGELEGNAAKGSSERVAKRVSFQILEQTDQSLGAPKRPWLPEYLLRIEGCSLTGYLLRYE